MWFILFAFLIIKRHIQPYSSSMKDPYRHWIPSSAGCFKQQSKYTEVFSNNAGLPTTTLLFIYVFIWISCILVEMLGAAGPAIWGPFDMAWLALANATLCCPKVGLFILGSHNHAAVPVPETALFSQPPPALRRMLGLAGSQWCSQRNVALELRMHRSGVGLGFT